MKIILCLGLLCVVACAATRPAATPTPPPEIVRAPITRVNLPHRFVVLDFTGQIMPAVGTKLRVYRDTERVGEVQITLPVRVDFATADILTGELRVGDEAR